MIIQIENSSNNESKEDTQLEFFSNADTLDISIKYEWDNYDMRYKKTELVSLEKIELREFFNSVKAIEKAMIEAGEL